MARFAAATKRKPRLRTELSEADEGRLQEAVALFGLPKAEVVRRLIRASVLAGPALSAENMEAVVALAAEVRQAGRTLAQMLRMMRQGRGAELAAAEQVWSELHGAITAIDEELTEMTVAYGARLRGLARLSAVEPVRTEGTAS
ncbi:MAG: hypothetical protein GY873_22500 [Bosea sp.]|jgi:hypothetical protein|uniref:hypothetical protein n=1 Tax=Hyphomicrobiales TaxID=356 RepID=UPI0008300882|nr:MULTISPECIES: hypothetical protein [Hyphomicrobiales]MCP4561771.1 hypothetical protein [Bosea sp. (in: a-proteobacteria)]MCP4736962.1 hypothetical protein [Bosea sp. (in: a-proteobacteria)]MDX3805958.1 hypothetical protein [Bosea sp. (in: a-proteobacteria)]